MGRQVCMEGRGMWQKFGENCFILSGSQNCQKKRWPPFSFPFCPRKNGRSCLWSFSDSGATCRGGGVIYDSQGKNFHNLGSLWNGAFSRNNGKTGGQCRRFVGHVKEPSYEMSMAWELDRWSSMFFMHIFMHVPLPKISLIVTLMPGSHIHGWASMTNTDSIRE